MIRGVAVAGGPERQHLPDRAVRIGEKFDEAERVGAKRANPTRSGEGGGVQQNAGGARKLHGCKITSGTMRLLLPHSARRLLHATLGCSLLVATACTDSRPAPKAVPVTVTVTVTPKLFHAEWSKNAIIYEVNIRQYTPEGTFAAFVKEIPRLKSLGVDVLWIMPVQPIGKLNRKGLLGSYYSISNYHEFNPEFGNQEDFRALVNAAHANGMRVILDWVANHTAFDHPWITEHKAYYTLKSDGTISRARDQQGNETDWSDVADLNYDSRDMRASMITEMRWWLDNTHIDGFRCDIAGYVPEDFWKEVSDAFRPSRPDFFMLAEAEDPKLHTWFDATYGWELHHLLNDIAQGKKGTDSLTPFFAAQQAAYDNDAYRLNFTSNHDENSWNGSEFERMKENHAPAYVLSATVKNSMPLLYTGQEASLQKRLRFFDKDTVNWTGQSLAPFYSRLFELRHTQRALFNGSWGGTQTEITTNGDRRVYAFARTRDGQSVLIFVNFADTATILAFSDYKGKPGPYTDWFSGEEMPLKSFGTLKVPAHGFRILVPTPMRLKASGPSAE